MLDGPLKTYLQRVADGELVEDAVQEKAARALQRVHEEITASLGAPIWKIWARGGDMRGLYMYGGVGRGKSMLMDMFVRGLPDNVPSRRVHFHEFMIETHNYLHYAKLDGKDVSNAVPRLAKEIAQGSRVLCFDEFHVTDIADAMILGRLFTALFQQGVIVIATSNWAPDDLYKDGLQRDLFVPFIATLKRHCNVVHLDSPTDYRTRCLARGQVYFTPVDGVNGAAINKLFKELSGGTPPFFDKIEVKGREIEVSRVAGGVARFSFAELCERPHGAEDFLAIAARYHTVFIEHIPKMGYDRRNEAKRFMTLIDALYEAGTKVVFSAAAPPDELYFGDDHAYEFERTVSRLNEMQSTEYLSSTAGGH